jgi:hypothetical protein
MKLGHTSASRQTSLRTGTPAQAKKGTFMRIGLLTTSIAAALATMPGVQAQDVSNFPSPSVERYEPVIRAGEPLSAVRYSAPYAANASVGKIEVEVASDDLAADGQTPVPITVRVFDKSGAPLNDEVVLTVEVSGGRIQLENAATDELGSRALDADRTTSGTQVTVRNGVVRFNLLAPIEPQDVDMRITAGDTIASGTITFLPEMREMIAIGLLEGVIRLSKKDPDTIRPVRLEDGFERELRQWSRAFNNGKTRIGGRATVFLKGKISGSTLLTAAYDSDKETRARLLRDIRPEAFYPVYGDASIRGFEARSSSKLYVRLDNGKSYALYGDFSTGDGFAQRVAGGATAGGVLDQLGAYNRTLTGGRGHWEGKRGFLNVYAANDTLKQVVEEYRANGTSGPYAVRNSSALENSEKVEILVRNKDQLNVLAREPVVLQRFIDYTFEPFSGKILFKSPIPSLDESGNPVSIRVTYEVDQGGEKFWLGGVDGQFRVTDHFSIGGKVIEDRNPTSPFKLRSVNAGFSFGENTRLIAEIAQTESVAYDNANSALGPVGRFTNPFAGDNDGKVDLDGKAYRVELLHQTDQANLRAYYGRADEGFDNPGSGWSGGKREAALQGRFAVGEKLSLFGEAIRTEDSVTDGRRDGVTLGAEYRIGERFSLFGGARRLRENGDIGSQAFIGANPSAGSLFNPTGGFIGGIDPNQVNPFTGQSITNNVSGLPSGGAGGADIDATTVYLGGRWKATDDLSFSGLLETDVSGAERKRFELGAAYQIAERTRIYARAERQTGLSSQYSLNQGDESNAFVLGVDNTYMNNSSGIGQVFSEYRLRDGIEGREAQNAVGLRNTFYVQEGIALSTSAEYLKVFDGSGTSAAAATFGIDYTRSELWKGSGRLEARRTFDNNDNAGDDSQTSVLSTLAFARKLDRNWTALFRNYYLHQFNNGDDANGRDRPDGWQNRFQVGFAYRPVDHNRLDILSKYEFLTENNIDGGDASADVHVLSTHAVYHPSRPWWLSGRIAAKLRDDEFGTLDNNVDDRYTAWLVGGRLIYDITENWDMGLLVSSLHGRASDQSGTTHQYAYGVEVGRLLYQNLWLSAGYNWSGFSDDDLVGSDYTNQGAYIRLRFKFDENLFRGGNRDVNRSLDR